MRGVERADLKNESKKGRKVERQQVEARKGKAEGE